LATKEFAMLDISTKSPRENLADDIIWGVNGEAGIAAFIGIEPRKAYYLISKGKIPVQKHGSKTITASRSQLRRLFSPVAA
jgi:hypothetical protein